MKKKKIYPRGFNRGKNSTFRGFLNRLLSSQLFLGIVGLILLVCIIFPVLKTYNQHRLMTKEIKEVQKQINNYESQNKQLENLMTYLHSDQSLETQARLNLNMKKVNEGVIVIKDKKINNNQIKVNSQVKEVSNLLKWWHYFFN